MKKLYTFGEFLNYMLEKRSITILELQSMLGLKSRTMIYRVIQEEAKLSTLLDMKDDIAIALELTPSEMKEMETSLNVSTLGKETIYTQEKILEFLKNTRDKRIPNTDFNKILCFSDKTFDSIEDILNSYSTSNILEINIINCISKEFMYKLSKFIQKTYTNYESIKIEHVIQMNKSSSSNIDTLECILELLSFKYYNAYYNPDVNMMLDNNFSVLSDILIIKSKTGTRERFDLLKLDKPNQTISYYSSNDINFYNLNLNIFLDLKASCRLLTTNFDNEDFLENIIDISNYYFELEKNTNSFMLKPDPCYSTIGSSIILNMINTSPELLSISGIKDSPRLALIKENLVDRFDNINKKHRYTTDIFSISGIDNLISKRKLTDHVWGLREFNLDEIKKILVDTLQLHLSLDNNYKFFIAKDFLFDSSFFLYYIENKLVTLENFNQKYNDDFKTIAITSKTFITSFDNFFKNVLLTDYIFSEEEGVTFMNKKIKEVDDMIKAGQK